MNSFKSRVKKTAPNKPKHLSTSLGGPGLINATSPPLNAAKQIPSLQSMIANRDWIGVITLCDFELNNLSVNHTADEATTHTANERSIILECWIAFAAFHAGEYQKALDTYEKLLKQSGNQSEEDQSSSAYTDQWRLYSGCCQYYLGNYTEAQTIGQSIIQSIAQTPNQSPTNQSSTPTPSPNQPNLQSRSDLRSLATRLLFHCSHHLNDEQKVLSYHGKMSESTIDQLSLASIHYVRNHYQEATDIYKKLLILDRECVALQLYIAMCYYKLDYYDVSCEILAPYLAQCPDSATAINLKACNAFKLFDGKAAEQECKSLCEALSAQSSNATIENDLIRHNLVVFRGGNNALTVFPPLLGLIPEARLNLCIYHLRNHDVYAADTLMSECEPTTPQEYILKGVVASAIGQLEDSKTHLKAAQEYFQLVGASSSECDTIPGRQCMASCFFILKQFDDALIYLNSIKAYSSNDSTFFFNYGVALAATEQFAAALEAFEQVQDVSTKQSYTYLSWLARCYCMTGQPRSAWELYLKMESNADSYSLLVLIANDCYKIGEFFYSMKAYDVLERLDPSSEHWEGKRGAAIGVLQAIIAKKERRELLKDVIHMLKSNASNAQADQIVRILRKYAAEVGIAV